MKKGTSLGQMSSRRLDMISTAIVGILVQASRVEDALSTKLGLYGVESVPFDKEQVDWLIKKLHRPTTLPASSITDRLPDKYELHPQQVTKQVRRLNRTGRLPATLKEVKRHARLEFVLMPEVTKSQLFSA